MSAADSPDGRQPAAAIVVPGALVASEPPDDPQALNTTAAKVTATIPRAIGPGDLGVMPANLATAPDLNLGTFASMSDYVIPPPEPKEIDEKLSLELRHLSSNAVLKGHPSGNEKCDNCLYYLEPTAEISYCWHLKLRILVGAEWWCQWWEKIPEDA